MTSLVAGTKLTRFPLVRKVRLQIVPGFRVAFASVRRIQSRFEAFTIGRLDLQEILG